MTDATVAADLHQALDVQRNFTTEVTFDLQVVLDVIAQLADVGLGEILHASVGVDAHFRQHLLRSLQTDAVDVGQAVLHSLFTGHVNT